MCADLKKSLKQDIFLFHIETFLFRSIVQGQGYFKCNGLKLSTSPLSYPQSVFVNKALFADINIMAEMIKDLSKSMRVGVIETPFQHWQCRVLPLNYTRNLFSKINSVTRR